MLKSGLVLFHVVVANVVHSFAVDPNSTEEAGAFTFLLTDDLAARYTVVNEGMSGALAVANLTAGDEELGQVFDLLFLWLACNCTIWILPLLVTCLRLHFFDLFIILPLDLYAFQELTDELLHLSLCEVK